MMTAMRISSRSISNDIYFEKMKTDSMKMHKQKLSTIRNQPRHHYENYEHEERLKQLAKYKKASTRVEQDFCSVKLENKSLVGHISEIKRRKSEYGMSLKLLHNYRSDRDREEERNEIKKQNKMLILKILEEKSKLHSRRELKKEIKEYETKRNSLRKLKSKSQL